MKHLLLLLLSTSLLCLYAQDEVEFIVNKQQGINVPTYYYRHEPTNKGAWINNIPGSYLCIQNHQDTFNYYSLRDVRDTLGLIRSGYARKIQKGNKYFNHEYGQIYANIKDTIWEKRIHRNSLGYPTIFCNYTVSGDLNAVDISYPIDSNIIAMEIVLKRIAYMIDSNVSIPFKDTAYTCIKVLVVNYGDRPEYYAKGKTWKTRYETYYDRTYYYLRKSDYLIIKIETASTVKQLDPYASYTPEAYPLRLIKAIE